MNSVSKSFFIFRASFISSGFFISGKIEMSIGAIWYGISNVVFPSCSVFSL